MMTLMMIKLMTMTLMMMTMLLMIMMMAITMMMTMTTTRDDTTLESFTMECEEGEECCGSLREYFEKYFEVYEVKQIYIHIAHEWSQLK